MSGSRDEGKGKEAPPENPKVTGKQDDEKSRPVSGIDPRVIQRPSGRVIMEYRTKTDLNRKNMSGNDSNPGKPTKDEEKPQPPAGREVKEDYVPPIKK